MNRLYRTFSLLLVSVFLFQCQKDLSYIGGADMGVPGVATPDPIKTTLQGNILDENNLPAGGVTITAGNQTSITDATGYFRINEASLDKNTSLVTAEKARYFKGYRVFGATSGTNQVVIKLIKKNLAGTITASSGGSATLSNGTNISLPANGVVVASSGNAYSGDIKVYASYIDPGANDIAETVPGSFMATDKNGKLVTLASFGMLVVELESAGGEKLQIKPGTVATLTSPIPSAALSSAPATIALWYVDEQTGLWKEKGAATRQGNNYVGDVKHFSFWNCDRPFNAVNLSLTLHDGNKSPLVHVKVKITCVDTAGLVLSYGYTDSLGQVKGLVPANKNLLLEVLDPCDKAVYSQNISPLSQNIDLGIIRVTIRSSSLPTITGKLLDCNGSPIKKGYAIISSNNIIRYASTDATGQFSIALINCAGSPSAIKVIGVDETSQQQGTATTVTVTTPITNAGNITACGMSSTQYINYTLDGKDYSITSTAKDSIMGFNSTQGTTTITYITGAIYVPGVGHNYLNLSVNNASATGTFPVSSFAVQNYRSVILKQPFNVTFTSFAKTVGEFYQGTLSGQFTADSLATVHNISSTFRVRRNN